MSTYLSSETLRGLRTESGLTQAALAERIGVTDKAVSKWETGRACPSPAPATSTSSATTTACSASKRRGCDSAVSHSASRA